VVIPFTSSWKKKAMREGPCLPSCGPGRAPTHGRRADPAANWFQPVSRSAGQPGISWYLPAELILNRKNLPLTRLRWSRN